MYRNAIGCVLTLCLLGLADSANTVVQRQQKPDQQQQQVLIDEDEYIPYAHSGVRDDFDWQLLQELSATSKGNTIISPISLKLILALLYEGAGGMTEIELENVLQFTNKSEVRKDYASMLEALTDGKKLNCENQPRLANAGIKTTSLQTNRNPATTFPKRQTQAKSKEYTLNLGTRIYLDQILDAQQPFEAKACEKYLTKIVPTNFSNPEKASTTINNYVNKITEGKISRLVAPGDVEHAVMLFVNALYFKGYWSHQFPKDKSHTGGFYLAPGQAVQVQYMATTDVYFYVESAALDAKIIRIPYKGQKFSMFVILPNAKAGLNSLLDRVNVMKLRQDVYNMDKHTVDLVMPKFMFDFQARMSDTLRAMGLRSMFETTASLPGIVRGSEYKLQVSDVIQKAGIEVDEEGSTAFAASDIQLTNKFGDAQVMFNATHPFLFYIEDQVAKTILFVGKVVNPKEGVTTAPLPPRFSELALSATPAATQSARPAYQEQQIAHYQPPPQQEQFAGQGGMPLYIPSSPPSGLSEQSAPSANASPGDESVSKRFNYFDLELLEVLALGSHSNNIFVSPASIKATLGMILEGAKGKSASEIAILLRIPEQQQYAREELKKLLYDISGQTGYTKLVSANGIFVSDKLKVLGAYKQNLQNYYKAQITQLNYDNIAQSANTINNWVASTTGGLIPSIVGPENINKDSSILLTNAMYFKSIWKYAFDPTQTSVKCFYLADGQCQNVKMMMNNAEVRYKMVPEINAHALEIPYSDDYAMLILLPLMRHSTSSLLRDLQHVTFNAIVDKLVKTEVAYEIPKFNIEYNVPLRNALQKLEIREIFGNNANLSGIVQNEQVHVDNIVHKAIVEVNEYGTIAAAATSAVVIPLMGSSAPHVIANHPFAFFIYKTSNRNIVFEGVVNHPTEATPAATDQSGQPLQPIAPVSRINAQRQRFAGAGQGEYRFL